MMCKVFLWLMVAVWCSVCCGQTVQFDPEPVIAAGKITAARKKDQLARRLEDEGERTKYLNKTVVNRQQKEPMWDGARKVWVVPDRKEFKATEGTIREKAKAMKQSLLFFPQWITPTIRIDQMQVGDYGYMIDTGGGMDLDYSKDLPSEPKSMLPFLREHLKTPSTDDWSGSAVTLKVLQIFDASSMLCSVRGSDVMIVLKLPSDKFVTGAMIPLPFPFFVEGTQTYTTVLGGTNTTFVLRPLTKEEQQKLSDAVAQIPEESRVRTWTDVTGQHKIEAELVDLLDNTAHLKKADGSLVKIPLSKLSKEDRKLAQELLGI